MTPLQPNNKCLTSVATGECLFVAKARAELGVGPGGPAPPPPFCPGFFSFVNVCRMFNMESRHLLNSSVQNAPDCISENFQRIFPEEHAPTLGARDICRTRGKPLVPRVACARNSPLKCTVLSPDERYRAHIATVYSISGPPLSQNPPYAPVKCSFSESKATVT